MRSLIIIEVEHGEDTDALDQFIADCRSEADYSGEVKVLDYTVRVDLPDPHRDLGAAQHEGHDLSAFGG